MTNKRFRDAIATLGLNQTQAAKALFVSLRTVHGYCNDQAIPKRVAAQLAYYEQFGLELLKSLKL